MNDWDNENYVRMYTKYRQEVLEHFETRKESKNRLKQIQHLLVENAQLARELDQTRQLIDSLLVMKSKTRQLHSTVDK